MTNLTHISFLRIYFNSLHVSSNGDLHTKRSLTQSDICRMLYWYNWFSWWWARGRSKHVENWNKYIENNCTSSWSITKTHKEMHGQQNIKTTFFFLLFSQVWLGLFPITEFSWVNMLTWIWSDKHEYLSRNEHFLSQCYFIGSISLFILELHF